MVHAADRLGTIRCSTSTSSAGGPGSPPLNTPNAPLISAAWSAGGLSRRVVGRLRDGEGEERIAPIRAELQRTMDVHASVFRTENSLTQAADEITRLKARYRNVSISDRAGATTPICSRPSSWASCSTSRRYSSPVPRLVRSHAVVTSARTSRSATTSFSPATRWLTRRRGGRSGARRVSAIQARRRHPLSAHGTDVLRGD